MPAVVRNAVRVFARAGANRGEGGASCFSQGTARHARHRSTRHSQQHGTAARTQAGRSGAGPFITLRGRGCRSWRAGGRGSAAAAACVGGGVVTAASAAAAKLGSLSVPGGKVPGALHSTAVAVPPRGVLVARKKRVRARCSGAALRTSPGKTKGVGCEVELLFTAPPGSPGFWAGGGAEGGSFERQGDAALAHCWYG